MWSSRTRARALAGAVGAVTIAAGVGPTLLAGAASWPRTAVTARQAPAGGAACPNYEPHLDPKNFVSTIDNPYFPLPVGRTWVYKGVKDGQSQIDRVHVTNETKVIEGITARVVVDVSSHQGHLLEKTFDWYAQDVLGNVWYLGENTTAYLPNGKKDKSGSWKAGVRDAEPGIIMLADPRIPDSYRQECWTGQAEDTAWVVLRGGSLTVPFGRVRNALVTLESARIEPEVYDQKIYAHGIGIVLERALTGEPELAKLVRMTG
jgi:hypothetical protein